MSSLTGQESSNTQPNNPFNTSYNTSGTFKGDSSVPFKTGAQSDPAGLSTSVDKVYHYYRSPFRTSSIPFHTESTWIKS
jgi:hypothetical protein